MAEYKFVIRKGPLAGKRVRFNMAEKADPKGNPAQAIVNFTYEILDRIVGPLCGIPGGISADVYLAGLFDYGRRDQVKRILDKIAKDYGVDRDYLKVLEKAPIGLIAMYVMENRIR
jgi:hypothetical protein